MDWREEYQRKLVSPEEAVKVVKSGDRVFVPLTQNPEILQKALFKRKDELTGVRIHTTAPSTDPGWFSEDTPAFQAIIEKHVGYQEGARQGIDSHTVDFLPLLFSYEFKNIDEGWGHEVRNIDVLVLEVTPPNKQGFVNLGPHVWDKMSMVRRAAKIIAEVHPDLPWVFGDNNLHVSQIDYFVQGPRYMTWHEVEELIAPFEPLKRERLVKVVKASRAYIRRALVPRLLELSTEELEVYVRRQGLEEPAPDVKAIAQYVGELVRDGDTIQFGTGPAIGWIPRLGVLDNKIDLGYHGEMAARGIARLVKEGVITGKRKTVNPGLAVASAWTGCDEDDLEYIAENPLFFLRPNEYTNNIGVVAAHDNFVAINTVMSVDLTGQINGETQIGPRVWSGHGGLPEFALGALYSRGGRSLALLPSTAVGGKVSRIMPMFEPGTCVTVPRYAADYVVTEFGYTRLWGKPFRQRAEDLIGIAHPDFQAELRREARKLFWP